MTKVDLVLFDHIVICVDDLFCKGCWDSWRKGEYELSIGKNFKIIDNGEKSSKRLQKGTRTSNKQHVKEYLKIKYIDIIADLKK